MNLNQSTESIFANKVRFSKYGSSAASPSKNQNSSDLNRSEIINKSINGEAITVSKAQKVTGVGLHF